MKSATALKASVITAGALTLGMVGGVIATSGNSAAPRVAVVQRADDTTPTTVAPVAPVTTATVPASVPESSPTPSATATAPVAVATTAPAPAAVQAPVPTTTTTAPAGPCPNGGAPVITMNPPLSAGQTEYVSPTWAGTICIVG
jgi:hypothetical protein